MVSEININYIEKLLTLLDEFNNTRHQYLNLDKVANSLGLSQEDLDKLVGLVFQFQKLFFSYHPSRALFKVRKNGTWYLTYFTQSQDPSYIELQLSSEECNDLSDIVYYFQHISKGKGFNLHFSTTELVKKVKRLKKQQPEFFELRGNGLIYPTYLAISLGKMLETYNRTNKTVSQLICENYKIQIV